MRTMRAYLPQVSCDTSAHVECRDSSVVGCVNGKPMCAQERRFRSEYSDYIAAYNKNLENHGLALGEWRSF